MANLIETTASGQWVTPHSGTGNPINICKIFGWTSAAMMLVTPSTAGMIHPAEIEKRHMGQSACAAGIGEIYRTRTPQEDLIRIQEILSPSVTDLASAIGVTSQTIYNWRKGEMVHPDHAKRLRDFALASDILSEGGVKITSTIMKRKLINGQTLWQVAKTGSSICQTAALLVETSKREEIQRARLMSKFPQTRNTPASEDFDFPEATNQE